MTVHVTRPKGTEPQEPARWRRPCRYRPFLVVITAALTISANCFSSAADAEQTPARSGAAPATSKPEPHYWLGKPPNYQLGLPPLPAAAPLPKTPADEQASVLASEVEGGGDQSLPALLAALSVSGITVQASNGSLLRPSSSPGQGIVIDQGDVEVLEMLAKSDVLVPLTGFASALGAVSLDLKSAPVAADILTGLRADATSYQPQVRFFARFVIAVVGDAGYNPRNIYADDEPATVTLDGVALDLITLRLAADFNGLAAGGKQAVVNSGFELPEGAASRDGPCNLDEDQSQVMDAAANSATVGFDKLVDYLKEHGVGVSGLLNGVAHESANVLLSIMKAISYVVATKVTLSVSPAVPGPHQEQI